LVVQGRRQVGLSQRELARRAGVSRTTVAEIESGSRDPGLKTLRAVLRGASLDLDIHLIARDDHDEVLDQTLGHLPETDRNRLEHGFERFVQGLADGLATSRPLVGSRE
jgi:transcriptional regulator with XRE-family HTH domain